MPRDSPSGLAVVTRRSKVAALFLRGVVEPVEIATTLGLPLPAGVRLVRRDLAAIRKSYAELATPQAEEMRGVEAARLDAVEASAWRGWRRSRRGRTTVQEKQAPQPRPVPPAPAPPHPVALVEVETTHVSSPGDPRFLSIVLDCVRQRRELFNLDVPKDAPPPPSNTLNVTNVTVAQFNQLTMAERLALAGDGKGAGEGP